MVTPEERITRLEAIQESNSQQLALVLSRLDQVVNLIEAVRQEAREMNEAVRQEAREMNEAARQEAREMNEAARQEAREDLRALRQETHQQVDGARKDARNLFIAGLAIVSAWGGGLIGLAITILQRLPS